MKCVRASETLSKKREHPNSARKFTSNLLCFSATSNYSRQIRTVSLSSVAPICCSGGSARFLVACANLTYPLGRSGGGGSNRIESTCCWRRSIAICVPAPMTCGLELCARTEPNRTEPKRSKVHVQNEAPNQSIKAFVGSSFRSRPFFSLNRSHRFGHCLAMSLHSNSFQYRN